MSQQKSYYNFLIVTFVALGSFTYGFNSAIMGLVIGLPAFFRYFNISLEDDIGNSIIGATNGLYSGGGALGCIFVPWLLAALGRRKTIQIASTLAILSAALQAGSIHIAMFLVARFLNGVAVGMLNTSIPVFQSEISLARERGRMVGTHGVLVVTGYSAAGFAGFGTYYARSEITWRLCLALQITAPLLLIIGTPWLPESPRWLALNARYQESYDVLKSLHSNSENGSDDVAKAEFCSIVEQLYFEKTRKAPDGWVSMMKTRSYRKRLLLGFGVQFIAQSTGVLVVNNYQVLLYNSLSITGSLPLLLNGIYNGMAAFMNWINSLFLDRLGRIRIMLIGITGCVCSLIGFTAILAQFAGTTNRLGNGFGVFFLFAFVFFYGATMDATSYVYCAEIFPTSVRAQGNGFSVAGLFTATLVYTQVAPIAFAKIGWRYYLVFIIVPTIGALCLWKFFPETKRLSLEEISGLFGDNLAMDTSNFTEEERASFNVTLNDLLEPVIGTATVAPHPASSMKGNNEETVYMEMAQC